MRKWFALSLLLLASPAMAWNLAGHMIVGAITYDVLKKEKPQTLAKLIAILKQHPQYADNLSKKMEAVDEADRDKYLVMICSRWPDDIRKNPEYHHGEWHYVDFPFVPAEYAGKIPTSQPAESNALVAYKNENDILRAKKDPAAMAIAACWVLHLSGDLDQPLHAVSMYSPEYPNGDKGGNSVWVTAEAGGSPVNLHSLWDGLVSGTDRFTEAKNIATELENRPDFAINKLTELKTKDPLKWAQDESFPLAVKMAYLDGKLPHSTSRDEAPVLPEGYLKAAKAVAERRVLLSGYRAAQSIVDDLGQ